MTFDSQCSVASSRCRGLVCSKRLWYYPGHTRLPFCEFVTSICIKLKYWPKCVFWFVRNIFLLFPPSIFLWMIMGLDVRKPVFGICEQQRRRQAFTLAPLLFACQLWRICLIFKKINIHVNLNLGLFMESWNHEHIG